MSFKHLKVAVILGTRPEIIKLASILKTLKAKRIRHILIHTGQHYSAQMDQVFFKDLKLKTPDYMLNIGAERLLQPGEQTGQMIERIEKVLAREKPSHVLVQGDTNSALAGALAASKLGISLRRKNHRMLLGHVEAGLRSGDRNMPEELNRVVCDHLSDFLFSPTAQARTNLIAENIPARKIWVSGNTVADAVRDNLRLALMRRTLSHAAIYRKPYWLMTLHRQENVDVRRSLEGILEGVHAAAHKRRMTVIYPVHPRTARQLKKFKLKVPESIQMVSPAGFFDFLLMEKNAQLILTDSGGVQEEACILGVPCVTLRTTTERPETLRVGANVLAGIGREGILRGVDRMLKGRKRWRSPFGDGFAGERIVKTLLGGQAA